MSLPTHSDPPGWDVGSNDLDLTLGHNTVQAIFRYVRTRNYSSNFPQYRPIECVPKSCTEKISEIQVIERFIEDQALRDKISQTARTLFAIVLYSSMGKPGIESFLDEALKAGIDDKALPITDMEKYDTVFGDGTENNMVAVASFHSLQKRFCLPSFRSRIPQQIGSGWGMPLRVGDMVGRGTFGRVFSVQIHPDHDEIGKVSHFTRNCTYSMSEY